MYASISSLLGKFPQKSRFQPPLKNLNPVKSSFCPFIFIFLKSTPVLFQFYKSFLPHTSYHYPGRKQIFHSILMLCNCVHYILLSIRLFCSFCFSFLPGTLPRLNAYNAVSINSTAAFMVLNVWNSLKPFPLSYWYMVSTTASNHSCYIISFYCFYYFPHFLFLSFFVFLS